MSDGEIEFVVNDDSGVLGLVDCASYAAYVSEEWTYESLVAHFIRQMERRSILVWGCGDGGAQYSMSVRRGMTDRQGFRETTGGIVVTKDRLQIASYTALTMAAQFEDETLPRKFEAQFSIPLSAGAYKVRIVQMFDPKRASETPAPDFLIEIEPGDAPPWAAPAWLPA